METRTWTEQIRLVSPRTSRSSHFRDSDEGCFALCSFLLSPPGPRPRNLHQCDAEALQLGPPKNRISQLGPDQQLQMRYRARLTSSCDDTDARSKSGDHEAP